jgi:hypothetical protein
METQEYLLGTDGTKRPYTAKTDLGRLVIKTRNDMILSGQKMFSYDEIMDAFHDERAGGEGLGRLWKQQ